MILRILTLLLVIAGATLMPAWGDAEIEIKRNPFVFASPPAKHFTILELILISNEDRSAIINGKRYRIGDIVGSYEIVSISLGYIQITDGRTMKRVLVNEYIK